MLAENSFKKEGYFVEFGGTNGLDLSNTHFLETEFNWQGIIAEPAKTWHQDLKNNRSCHIETDYVWLETAESLIFNEVDEGEFSTLDEFTKSDHFSNKRKQGKTYLVTTISLNDLLKKYNAPKDILITDHFQLWNTDYPSSINRGICHGYKQNSTSKRL